MKFRSTRNTSASVGFSEAVANGMAPDGGLYVPESLPRIDVPAMGNSFLGEKILLPSSLGQIAQRVLAPFVAGDAQVGLLKTCCERAFNFELKMPFLEPKAAILELFHGPTAAFKDFGARFLAEWTLTQKLGPRPLVLVATSGDTGGAVAAAFYKKPGIDVAILFPKGRVSKRQQMQLTCWGENIHAYAVEGVFDDCQRMVKEAFADEQLRQARTLLSANSINLGRLLPQMVYYAAASLRFRESAGEDAGFIVPSGNLGNAVACLYAKAVGFPIREVVLATNANRSLTEFFNSGTWAPHPTVETLANAMDVGNPSNFERLRDLYPDFSALKSVVRAEMVSDDQIRETVRAGLKSWHTVFCPHTATAAAVYERVAKNKSWVIVATADPAKFETLLEPLIGTRLEAPPSLQPLMQRPERLQELPPRFLELKKALL